MTLADPGAVFAPAPTGDGFYLYREPGWKRCHIVDVGRRGATFTNEDGNGETEYRIADLPGEWSGPSDRP